MKIYRLSIVERDLPYNNPQSKIIDFKHDFEFRKFDGLKIKLKGLLKKGYSIDTIDCTTWNKDGLDYDITFDPFKNLESLIREIA